MLASPLLSCDLLNHNCDIRNIESISFQGVSFMYCKFDIGIRMAAIEKSL